MIRTTTDGKSLREPAQGQAPFHAEHMDHRMFDTWHPASLRLNSLACLSELGPSEAPRKFVTMTVGLLRCTGNRRLMGHFGPRPSDQTAQERPLADDSAQAVLECTLSGMK
jgi:hypothetical protein